MRRTLPGLLAPTAHVQQRLRSVLEVIVTRAQEVFERLDLRDAGATRAVLVIGAGRADPGS